MTSSQDIIARSMLGLVSTKTRSSPCTSAAQEMTSFSRAEEELNQGDLAVEGGGVNADHEMPFFAANSWCFFCQTLAAPSPSPSPSLLWRGRETKVEGAPPQENFIREPQTSAPKLQPTVLKPTPLLPREDNRRDNSSFTCGLESSQWDGGAGIKNKSGHCFLKTYPPNSTYCS